MFQSPDYYHNLSLRLSEVLSDIGVNERIVIRRRRAWLLYETTMNLDFNLTGLDLTWYNFGSQTEASTTLELNSDVDHLICLNESLVIQDWSEWKLGKGQYLMVQDETTSPGYCLLQAVRSDMPLPIQDIQHPYWTVDSRDRVLLRHSAFFQEMANGSIRHGPAQSVNRGPDRWDCDNVPALYCSSWPKEAEPWLQQQNVSGWPTADMKRYAVEHGCFFVATPSRAGVNEESEWRISTSQAERCLMLSLDMTQMRCYILMKMTIKTYLKPKCGDPISSFMCKTVLFHCIAYIRASQWNDSYLLPCLNQCLQYLLHCILTENRPHFFIPGNNLLAGKLSFLIKQQLVEIMMTLTANIELLLLGITIDQLGNRLHVKSGRMIPNHMPTSEWIAGAILGKQLVLLSRSLEFFLGDTLKKISHNNIDVVFQNLTQKICKICHKYSAGSKLEQVACCLFAPPLCSIIGSIIASVNIHLSQPVSPAPLQWFSAGLNSDFSSSRLKLASALYCAGHYEQCETITVHLNRQLEQTTVLSMCACTLDIIHAFLDFERSFQEKNDATFIHENVAFCIKFLPCEKNCVPEELRYEMFRTTQEDLPYRGEDDDWMDWAVIDSIPFLYFLQYKVYRQLHRPALQQQQALFNLARTINIDPNLGHRETALNLLGQCKEEENRTDEALCCYMMSLNLRPRNNAAKWHICRLLVSLYNHRL